MYIKNWLSILLVTLFVTSCAPMPGNSLLRGVTRASSIEEVEVIETISVYETQLYCTMYAPWYQVALNCLLNLCFIPACALPYISSEGVVKKCYVYMWIDNDYLREHERRHCVGYADLLY